MRKAFALAIALLFVGCATYREDLNRGQRYFEENEYDRSLAIWRMLETDLDSLEYTDQARYAYMRGMTDLRLDFRADARHWLAYAKAVEQEHPGGLKPEWKANIDKHLDELNVDWFRGSERFDQSRSTADVTTREAPGTGDKPKAGTCSTGADCPDGQTCQSGECVAL